MAWPPIKDAKGSSMSIKLTDTQLVLLSAAAQRKDRCVFPPETLKGGASQKVSKKLISMGLAKETKAKRNDPIWRRDEQSGASYALKLTVAGARAIGIDESIELENAHREDGALENRDQSVVPSKVEARDTPDAMESVPAGPHAPRRGSKLAHVIELLQRGHGATVDELIAATGWLAHTTRAALTGLRKRGYAVAIDRSDHERGSFYRIKAKGCVAPVSLTVDKPADSPTPRKPAQRLSKPRARRAA
jgi:Protein of unknown function (DUF3489)